MKEKQRIPDMLTHDKKDNVAVVVVEGFEGGHALCVCIEDNSDFTLEVSGAVPIGHKVALSDFQEGDTVYKYGEDIGIIKEAARKGDHIHTHNMKTKRW